jgi:hypothetical protein
VDYKLFVDLVLNIQLKIKGHINDSQNDAQKKICFNSKPDPY